MWWGVECGGVGAGVCLCVCVCVCVWGGGGGGGGGGVKNVYKLLNLRALKISMLYKNHIFQCMGKIIVWNFTLKGTFEIPHKYIIHTPHWKM